MGSPHLQIPVISVAGTNGKGSVSNIIQNILTASGKKVGIYTSPHIFDFRERIRIGSENIPLERFKSILKELRTAEKKCAAVLSKFEILTAVAIKYFHEENCDVSVMEAGLGGRLDATNVCKNKIISVITPISLEHTDYLGDTIEKIAYEKAGIIKDGAILVDASGVDLIRRIGKELECSLYSEDIEYTMSDLLPTGDGGFEFSYLSDELNVHNIKTGLKGIYQVYNAAAAIAAVSAFGCKDEKHIKNAIRDIAMLGRLNVVDLKTGGKLVIDAAHNPAGMMRVRDFISCWKPRSSEVYMITGVYSDKDFERMAEIIQPVIKKVCIFTPENERALEKEVFKDSFGVKGETAESFDDAFNKAVSSMKEGDWVLSCGSFSVVKPALEFVAEHEEIIN
jgi:dihydrofolate synthase/folylpolyglutamate synthase